MLICASPMGPEFFFFHPPNIFLPNIGKGIMNMQEVQRSPLDGSLHNIFFILLLHFCLTVILGDAQGLHQALHSEITPGHT